MESIDAIEARAAALSALVAEKFGPKGPNLIRQARKLGRRVPKAVREDLIFVGAAAQAARQPKRACLFQPLQVVAAAERATAHLHEIDPADRRRGAVLSWAAQNATNFLVLGVVVVIVLRWRGFV